MSCSVNYVTFQDLEKHHYASCYRIEVEFYSVNINYFAKSRPILGMV